MTEAGKKWIKDKTGEATEFDIGEAEFWIRAFCEEVTKRLGSNPNYNDLEDIGSTYLKLERELLGT